MKKALKILLGLLLALVLAVGVYVGYAFIVYERLDDNLPLEVEVSPDPTAHEHKTELAIPTTDTPYRILSYNVGFGAYSEDYSFFMDGGKESRARSPEAVYTNLNGAMEAAKAADPDFLFIEEVDVDGTRSHHVDERQIILDAFPGTEYVYAQNYDSPYLLWPLLEPHGANVAGQMTLSRFPVDSAIRRSLPIEGGFMKFLDLDRCYSVSRVPMENGKELVLFCFHLSAYTSDGTIAEDQLRMLFSDMDAEVQKGNYTIAGGDFNKDILGNSAEIFKIPGDEFTWAQPIPQELIPENFTIVAPFDEEAPVASCRNADRPYGPDDYLVTVDGFIVSDNVEIQEAKVIDTGFKWSDHNPVYMDFILK